MKNKMFNYVCILIARLIAATVAYFLWNWLVPRLFNGPYLTWWETLGLSILISSLTGFFRRMQIEGDNNDT